ncbi:hypothetical protein ACHHYP_20364 [Achlya hypogyna]|uniref:Uncharacterized protein n=1 Tax=Achlya hypogyna TaxID=1202772 RepID=A0A1V9YPD9_ACHHY|nr:hypothetical protein ACHHYP_20364 [Achlya hypogyna]
MSTRRLAEASVGAPMIPVVLGSVLGVLVVVLVVLVAYLKGGCGARPRAPTPSLHKPRGTEPTVTNSDARDSVFIILGDTNPAWPTTSLTIQDCEDGRVLAETPAWTFERSTTASQATDFFLAPPCDHESIGCDVPVDIYGSSWGSEDRGSYGLSDESVLYLETRQSVDEWSTGCA